MDAQLILISSISYEFVKDKTLSIYIKYIYVQEYLSRVQVINIYDKIYIYIF